MESKVIAIVQIVLLLTYIVLFFVKPNKLMNIIIVLLIIGQLSLSIYVYKTIYIFGGGESHPVRCPQAYNCDCPGNGEMCDCLWCLPDEEGNCEPEHIKCPDNTEVK